VKLPELKQRNEDRIFNNAEGFSRASITIFSQKPKKRVYPKLTEGNFGKLLRFLAVLEEQKIVSERTKSRAYLPQR